MQCLHFRWNIIYPKTKKYKDIPRNVAFFGFWEKLSSSAQFGHLWRILHQKKEKYPGVIFLHACLTVHKLTTEKQGRLCPWWHHLQVWTSLTHAEEMPPHTSTLPQPKYVSELSRHGRVSITVTANTPNFLLLEHNISVSHTRLICQLESFLDLESHTKGGKTYTWKIKQCFHNIPYYTVLLSDPSLPGCSNDVCSRKGFDSSSSHNGWNVRFIITLLDTCDGNDTFGSLTCVSLHSNPWHLEIDLCAV